MYTIPTLTSAEQISSAEKATIEAAVARCLETHRQNRRVITQLTLECVTALTASEARGKELQRQGFFHRLWRHLTGKTLAAQTQISFELAQAQYASQQILQQLAQQHVLTFDVVTAVNNKLNTLSLEFDEELNRVYETLKEFFCAMRVELTTIQQQINHLDRNVTLLHWSHTIAYQHYHGVEYADLTQMEQMVCVVNDFFQQTQGTWSTSDLMLLKATLDELGVAVKDTLTPRKFFQTLLATPDLIQRLFLEIPVIELEQLEMFDAPLLKGIEKLQRLGHEEAYLVNSLLAILQSGGEEVDRKEAQLSLLEHYLRQYAAMNVEQEMMLFDLVLEVLVGLRMMFDLHQQLSETPVSLPEKEELSHQQQAQEPEAAAAYTALDQRMLGRWRCEWYLPRLNYCAGQLEIFRKTEAEHYSGRLELDTLALSEETAIVVKGEHVTIHCFNPSKASWNPDLFEVTLNRDLDVMSGFSQHPRGFRGKITFSKV